LRKNSASEARANDEEKIMKGISEFTAEQIKHWNVQRKTADGRWVSDRPLGYYGNWFWRLGKAWKVFKGEADVLTWEEEK